MLSRIDLIIFLIVGVLVLALGFVTNQWGVVLGGVATISVGLAAHYVPRENRR